MATGHCATQMKWLGAIFGSGLLEGVLNSEKMSE